MKKIYFTSKNKLTLVLSIAMIIIPFVDKAPLVLKCILPTGGIGIIAGTINNRIIRYAIILICLLIISVVYNLWSSGKL